MRTDPPTYHWEAVGEATLQAAAAEQLQIIATVHYTPDWAQKTAGSYCGPIREDALDPFAQFLTALVTRYSAPPYNVHYWELGNEPDVDPSLVGTRSAYGCWGDQSDAYYGGGYYAEMLKVAYPAIKAADPKAQVLIGGLLLGCDPTHPLPKNDCKPSRFLEGILQHGGGAYFDVLSFHGYPQYNGSLRLDEHFPSWEERGGVVLGKVHFLREVMSAYDVDKPIIHTEGALLCPKRDAQNCNPPGPAFYEAQADYVVWLFVRNWAERLVGTVWYEFEGPGWQESGLLDSNQQPKPAYRALSFLTEELASASYQQPVIRYPDLKGYEFTTPTKRVWVLWAPDGQPHSINLPTGALRVLDKYGQKVTPVKGTVSVSSPVYVELTH